jgi:hypothetical protein
MKPLRIRKLELNLDILRKQLELQHLQAINFLNELRFHGLGLAPVDVTSSETLLKLLREDLVVVMRKLLSNQPPDNKKGQVQESPAQRCRYLT